MQYVTNSSIQSQSQLLYVLYGCMPRFVAAISSHHHNCYSQMTSDYFHAGTNCFHSVVYLWFRPLYQTSSNHKLCELGCDHALTFIICSFANWSNFPRALSVLVNNLLSMPRPWSALAISCLQAQAGQIVDNVWLNYILLFWKMLYLNVHCLITRFVTGCWGWGTAKSVKCTEI